MHADKREDETFYKLSGTFMLRAPLLSLDVLKEISEATSLEELIKKYYSQMHVAEALFLASPGLYRTTERWINGEDLNGKEKLQHSLLKYLIRMSSRCTPFGRFAGICAGSFAVKNSIELKPIEEHHLHLRPDMQFLCSVSASIIADKEVREKLNFCPNTSMARIGNEYRYIEHHTDDKGLRRYRLQSLVYTDELEEVLNKARQGAHISELIHTLVDRDVNTEASSEYIHLLIDNQVLVSELEPTLTGEGFYAQLIKSIHALKIHGQGADLLRKTERRLTRIQSEKDSFRIDEFDEMISDVKASSINFEENALIQADLKLETSSCCLSESVRADLESIIPVLMKLSGPPRNPLLDRFKDNFLRRYEDQEVSLSLAMDVEAGPGYLADDQQADVSDLIDGLIIQPEEDQSMELSWTAIDRMLFRKWQQAIMNGHFDIELSDQDLNTLPYHMPNFPLSISLMARLYGKWDKNNDKHLIQIRNAGGNSAINLAGRFCYLDDGLDGVARDLAAKEQILAGKKILAEIVHLPQERTGNVLLRPVLHDYEIPYLSQPGVANEFVIPISDLLVSIRNGKLVLRSQRLNKFIVPRLSNAHNYTLGALATYRFLCDLQSQDIQTGLGFSWGYLEPHLIFKPRVSYENFILLPASWNLGKQDLQKVAVAEGDASLKIAIDGLRAKFKLPARIILTEADNELWIDLNSPHCMRMFQLEIRKRSSISLEECLHQYENGLVQAVDGNRTNEFVFFLHKNV